MCPELKVTCTSQLHAIYKKGKQGAMPHIPDTYYAHCVINQILLHRGVFGHKHLGNDKFLVIINSNALITRIDNTSY